MITINSQVPKRLSRRLLQGQLIPLIYRIIALITAAAYLFSNPESANFLIPPIALISVACAVTVLVSIPSFMWSIGRSPLPGTFLIFFEVIVCFILIILSGSIYSPFVLFSLSPVLDAGLFLNRRTTFAIAATVAIGVVLIQILNPLFEYGITLLTYSQLSMYIVAVCLIATLPFLINANQRKRLEEESIHQERMRLSREMHDGVAQTLLALNWQIQMLRRRMPESTGIENDLNKLEDLSEKSRRDVLELLEFLRKIDNNVNLVKNLKEYLQNFKNESNIAISLDVDAEELSLNSKVEMELIRICQEALANIKRHSGARHVHVILKKNTNNVEMSISDDGQGFDAIDYYRKGQTNKGHHGLFVMKERAQSVDGKLQVLSMPQRGTEIKVEIPLAGNGKVR